MLLSILQKKKTFVEIISE